MQLGADQFGAVGFAEGPSEFAQTIKEGVRRLLLDALGDVPIGLRREQGGPLPFIRYRRIDDDHEHYLSGPAGDATATFEFECLSTSDPEATRLSERVRRVLDGFIGWAWGRRIIGSMAVPGGGDDFEKPDDGGQKAIFKVVSQFEITYLE